MGEMGVIGTQLRCAIAPGLVVLVSDMRALPALHLSMRAHGGLVFQWRLAGAAQAVEDPTEPPNEFAYLSYLPPGAALEFAYPGGAWQSVALTGTPQALESRWQVATPLLEMLGLELATLTQCTGARRKVLAMTGAALEDFRALQMPPRRPELLRAHIEAHVLSLLCHTIQAGDARPAEDKLSARDIERVHLAHDAIVRSPAAGRTLQSLATQHGLNRNKLARGFREAFGMTVFEVLQQERLKLAWTLLEERDKRISEIARAVGYLDATSFTRAFRKHFGVSPRVAVSHRRKPQG
jgi:AraC-like DNA-binding protein